MHGPAFIGDRPDDRFQDVAANDRIQSRTGLVENQQVRTMRLCGDQAEPRALSLRQRLDARVGIQPELLAQLLGVGRVPARIESLGVAQQLPDAHPSRQVRFFGQVADASEDCDRIGHRIDAEQPAPARLRAPQPEQVFDQRRLAGAVLADQAKHAASASRPATRRPAPAWRRTARKMVTATSRRRRITWSSGTALLLSWPPGGAPVRSP